jgi:arylsulfatase A-like enzyme
VFASWAPVARAVGAADRVLVSTGRGGTNHPELLDEALFQLGEEAEPSPGYGNYRPDRYTAALALRYLNVHHPRFLFVSLGDTDEHAHHDDYADYIEALRHADQFIGDVALALERLRASGDQTLLIVTSDHGRSCDFANHGARWPESEQTWLVASGEGIAARGLVQPSQRYALADIAPTVRAIAGLAEPEPNLADGGRPIADLFRPARMDF